MLRARGRVRGHGARRRWWRRWRRRGWRRRPWSSLRAHAPPPCSRQRRAPRGRAAQCSQSSLVAVAAAPHSLPLPVRRVPSLLATADPHSSLPAEPHSLPPVHPHSLPRGPPTQAASPGSSRRRERGGRGAYRSSWRREGRRGPPPSAAGTASAAARACCACSAQAGTSTWSGGASAGGCPRAHRGTGCWAR